MSDNQSKSQPAQLLPGDRVGAYRIERELGSGGMADVFYGIHEGLERPAAIKVLRASLAADEVHLQRFMQEARAAASLVHPNIVQVYDVGQDGSHRYIAQEYIPGSNLRQYLVGDSSQQNENPGDHALAADRQLGLGETLSILIQILAALNKSATSGIVHRDIKPENIMLTRDGDVKVADFGLARILLGDDPQLTRAGTTLGTPMYMSPEQIQEGQVDVRSDLYSLGVTLYHMLSGRPPFTGETPLALAMKHVQSEVPDITQFRSNLPQSIIKLTSRLLEKSPDARFRTPAEVLEFLKLHRASDLANVWPDQTVPLPRAVAANRVGPTQATLLLQSKLRKTRRDLRGKLLAKFSLGALLLACFAGGTMLTFERPLSPTDMYKDIPREETVEKQYRAALLNTERNTAKWEAVEYYFPKDKHPSNRDYAGLASIQRACTLQAKGDYAEAKNVLNQTINDPQMGKLFKALAHLRIAVGAEEASNEEEMKMHVALAIGLASDENFSLADLKQLNSVVELMPSAIVKRWRAEQPT